MIFLRVHGIAELGHNEYIHIPVQDGVMAFDKWGHHWTQPIGSLQQFCSACSLAFVVWLSIALSSCCCTQVSLLPVDSIVRSSNCCMMLFHSSSAESSSLYFAMMHGSVHLSLLADRLTDAGACCQPRSVKGISIHSALWSLGMPLPKAKYLVLISGRSLKGKKYSVNGILAPVVCVRSGSPMGGNCCFC